MRTHVRRRSDRTAESRSPSARQSHRTPRSTQLSRLRSFRQLCTRIERVSAECLARQHRAAVLLVSSDDHLGNDLHHSYGLRYLPELARPASIHLLAFVGLDASFSFSLYRKHSRLDDRLTL